MNGLKKYAQEFGIDLNEEMLDKFYLYRKLLLDWNQRVNLTAITDPEEVLVKHFLDSILVLSRLELPQGASVVDVGTGAGFPSVPMKVVRPDLRLTLLDSLQKRTKFLEELSRELGQDNRIVHGRAEEVAHRTDFREQYDLAVARAVAALPALCEYCLPYARLGGVFVAMKGPKAVDELQGAERAIKLLGGGDEELHCCKLPDGSERTLISIKKISQTPRQYPRKKVKLTKTPL